MGNGYVAAGYLATAVILCVYVLFIRHRARVVARAAAGSATTAARASGESVGGSAPPGDGG